MSKKKQKKISDSRKKLNPLEELGYLYLQQNLNMILTLFESSTNTNQRTQYQRRKTNDSK